ncbi:MAG: helix-turn-helix domain-containing protein [Euryarchaeota archaeon]|nr:helix-turn-helix domain-containing protein [Euryarchaeota archaeon]
MPRNPVLRLTWLGLVALAAFAIPAATAADEPMQCDCGDMAHKSPADMVRGLAVDVATSPLTWGVLGVGLLGAGVWAWKAGGIPKVAAALALWSRFDADELDEHPTRSRILALLQSHPGSSTRGLAEVAELNAGTLLYHLEILASFGLVNSQRVGRERAWYLTRGAKPDLERRAILAAPARQRLLTLVEETPGLAQSDLARVTGLSLATVHHHVQALARGGLLELRRERGRLLCFVAAAGGPRFASDAPTFRRPSTAS